MYNSICEAHTHHFTSIPQSKKVPKRLQLFCPRLSSNGDVLNHIVQVKCTLFWVNLPLQQQAATIDITAAMLFPGFRCSVLEIKLSDKWNKSEKSINDFKPKHDFNCIAVMSSFTARVLTWNK